MIIIVHEHHLRRYMKSLETATKLDTGDDETPQGDGALDAALELFNNISVDLEGIGDEGEEKPEDWRDTFDPQQKATILQNAVFGLRVIEPQISKKKRPSWKGLPKHVTTIHLAILERAGLPIWAMLGYAIGKTPNQTEKLALNDRINADCPLDIYILDKLGSRAIIALRAF